MIYETRLITWIYRASPPFIQDALVSAYGAMRESIGRSRAYRRLRESLERSQWLSPGEHLGRQDEALRGLIRHAYENVPFYRRLLDGCRLRPEDIRTQADLWKIPVLTKEEVRRHGRDLEARNVPRTARVVGHTGGTTGVPLRLLLDRQQVSLDRALTERHWSWAGYRRGDRVAVLRGLALVPADRRPTRLWRRDHAMGRLYLSGFHVSPATASAYRDQILAWGARYLAGYPSSLSYLARLLSASGESVPVRAIFTSSELLTAQDRAVIEGLFGGRVWDRYGLGERIVVAQQCEHGSYHLAPELGIVQIAGADGPAAPGERGEVIATGLANRSMPLIRYATGDLAAPSEAACACGRGLPVMMSIDGRRDDSLVLPDGTMMPRAGLDQVYEYIPRIRRCQLRQESRDELIVRVEADREYSESDSRALVAQLRKRLGNRLAIRVERVDEIPLTGEGKFRFIVSTLTAGER